jgi:hypothetical protein
MTDAFSIGMMGTDVLTGRTPIAIATIPANLAAATGVCFQRNGANYQVAAGTTLYITGYFMSCAVNASSLTNYEIRYADDAVLTTNPVTIVPALLCPPMVMVSPVIATGRVAAPTGHYVGIYNPGVAQNAGTISVVALGYEQV